MARFSPALEEVLRWPGYGRGGRWAESGGRPIAGTASVMGSDVCPVSEMLST